MFGSWGTNLLLAKNSGLVSRLANSIEDHLGRLTRFLFQIVVLFVEARFIIESPRQLDEFVLQLLARQLIELPKINTKGIVHVITHINCLEYLVGDDTSS